MDLYAHVYNQHSLADYERLLNEAATAAGQPDFPSRPVTERVDMLETIHFVALKDPKFALPALESLDRFVKDESVIVRERVVFSACNIGHLYEDMALDVMFLLSRLSFDERQEVRSGVAKQIGVIGSKYEWAPDFALDMLAKMKRDDHAVVRTGVANSLSLIGRQGPFGPAKRARDILLDMKPDLDEPLNGLLNIRVSEINNAIDRNFERPQPPRRLGLG
jgi:hypothetical protein